MIKQIYRITLLLLAMLLPTIATAYDFEVDGIYYNINGNEATVTKWDCEPSYMGDVIIPAIVSHGGTTYSVTSIDDWAFSFSEELTSVDIPKSVTAIGEHVFSQCSNLTNINVESENSFYDSRNNCNAIIETATNKLIAGCLNTTIPNSITSIGNSAFEACRKLKSINIPNSVTSIGEGAFFECRQLTSIIIPNSVTSIGDYAFSCSGLASVNIPNSVTTIGESVFSWCINLTSINIPYSVTSIGDYAFDGCSGLTSITIPKSVTTIGSSAFYECSGLTSVTCFATIPPVVYNGTFYGVTSQATLYVPTQSLESYQTANYWKDFSSILAIEFEVDGIYYGALTDSTAMVIPKPEGENYSFTSVTIPETVSNNGTSYSVTSIGEYAFMGCDELKSVTMGNSITSIGDWAFSNCFELTSVNIPNSVISIGDFAFIMCFGLSSINIPDSVTSIGQYAFAYCSGLTRIIVNDGNPVYDSRNNCNAIIETTSNTLIFGCKNTIIPNSVKVIEEQAFIKCNELASITIPNSVTLIGNSAFRDCSRLISVTCLSSIPPECNYAFPSEVTDQATLYVPIWSLEDYQTANNWQDFNQIVGIVTIDDFEVDGIYYRALSENTVMVIQKPVEEGHYQGDVVIPDCVSHQDMQFTVTAIDAGAFEDCYELNSVVIGNAVENIGEEAFQGCTGLTSVTIGSGVTSIGEKAFNYCNALETVTCEGTVPPVMENSNCFSSAAYRRAVLKVPRLFVDAYTAADYWYKFEQIEGFGSIGPGDVNADGVISITDVTALIGLVLGSGEYNADADLNNNSKLDIGDVTSLIVLVLSM